MTKITPDSPLGKKLIERGMVQREDFTKTTLRRPNKWRNIPTEDAQGRVHPSKLQARITDRLRGEYLAVIPEVSMPLSERKNDRIRVDCLVIQEELTDGFFIGKFIEIKGRDLGEGKQKRRRFEDAYGVQIEVQTR